jgi:hypothetical protein
VPHTPTISLSRPAYPETNRKPAHRTTFALGQLDAALPRKHSGQTQLRFNRRNPSRHSILGILYNAASLCLQQNHPTSASTYQNTTTTMRKASRSEDNIGMDYRGQHSPATAFGGTLASSDRPSSGVEDFVDWDGPSDLQNPFNWSQPKKWRVTLLACFMTFIVQMNGTAMTSAAEQINESFNISDANFPHSYWPVLSWNLGGAVAPMLGLPLMENFGVRRTYLVHSAPYPTSSLD